MIYLLAQIPKVPDPSTIIEEATHVGWEAALIAFSFCALIIMAVGLVWYFAPLKKIEIEERNKAFAQVSKTSDVLEKLAEAHKERLDNIGDRLELHHKTLETHQEIAQSANSLLAVANTQILGHDAAALVMCRGLREFFQDENFPENKEKYIRYIDEFEMAIRTHNPSLPSSS